MNRRILKKKSKQAAPLLRYFDRFSEIDAFDPDDAVHDNFLKGTLMSVILCDGGGIYGPEYDEIPAFEHLRQIMDWEPERPCGIPVEVWEKAVRICGGYGGECHNYLAGIDDEPVNLWGCE